MSTDADSASSPLPQDVDLRHAVIEQLTQTNADLTRKLQQVEHYLAQLLRSKYGPRSEKCDPAQLALFQASAEEAAKSDAAEPVAQTSVRQHVRRGGGRNELPADLPRCQWRSESRPVWRREVGR